MPAKECDSCNTAVQTIPYIVHEQEMAHRERTERRLWITIILLIILLVGSNAGWIYYESQFEDVYQEVVQEADNGTNSFIGGNVYGETDY
jgi:hypothetical protein